jgi:hypothetical protein
VISDFGFATKTCFKMNAILKNGPLAGRNG